MATDPFESEGGEEFSPEILAAFDAYPAPSPSRGFEASFWSQFETRRSRYRGFMGLLRRLWELEIEGVVVWRLAASTLSGGLSCALLLGLATGLSQPQSASSPLPSPGPHVPPTTLTAFAFYNRDWEDGFYLPKALPKAAPLKPTQTQTPHQGGGLSWNVSSAHLV